jgi:hypothetical protein
MKLLLFRPFALGPALLLALLGSAMAASAQAPEPTDPVALLQRFYEARNAEDQAAALALVADDLYVPGTGLCPPERVCRGPAPLELDIANGIAAHARYTLVAPQVAGMTVTATLETRAPGFQAAGVDRVVGALTAEIREGKIATYQEVRDASDPQTAAFYQFQRSQAAAGQIPRAEPLVAPLCPGTLSCTYSERNFLPMGYRLQRLDVCGANCTSQYWVSSIADGAQLLEIDPVRGGGLIAVGQSTPQDPHAAVRTVLPDPQAGDPACCPSQYADTTDTWDAGSATLLAGSPAVIPAADFGGWESVRSALESENYVVVFP